jgi:uncharacterized lipoprotein YajG
MKKVTFLLATLLIGSMMLTGCKKDPQPTPTPDPESKTAKVVYKLGNTNGTETASDCFKYTVSYQGADGQMVTVNDVTLPWTSPEITVTLPFTAKIEGQASYNEADLPDPLVFGWVYSLFVNGADFQTVREIYSYPKEGFILSMAENPNDLKFSYSKTIEKN